MVPASELAERIRRVASIHEDLHGLLGDRVFDDLAIGKTLSLQRKVEQTGIRRAAHVCLGHNLRHAVPVDAQREYQHLPPGFLESEVDPVPPGSVVLLLNNDIGRLLPRWLEWSARRTDCLHVVWDWDSQHWLQMSCSLAAAADFYVPSTSENLHTLSHFTPNLLGPAFAAVNQWSRSFLIEHIDLLLGDRVDEPFGPHVRYDRFARRNRAVVTLNQSFGGIALTDNAYQRKTDLENLQEWAGHKAHWIIPVLGGVPIRVYNCLLTGGIPVLPQHVRSMPEASVVGEHALFYRTMDLVEPKSLQRQAVQRFDTEGRTGLLSRIGAAMNLHHIDTRCEEVLGELDAALEATLRGQGPTGLRYPVQH